MEDFRGSNVFFCFTGIVLSISLMRMLALMLARR